MAQFSDLYPRRFFLETWRDVDTEAAEERSNRRKKNLPYDMRPMIAVITAGVCLTIMEYFGQRSSMMTLLDYLDPREGRHTGFWAELRLSQFFRLYEFAWWALWRVFGYFVIPALVIKLVFREKLRSHGLSTRGFKEHLWIYAMFYWIVLMLIVGVSFMPDFTEYYPFYKQASRSWVDFLVWELLYASQFFALEFFFRGFWLRSFKSATGSHAIFAMIVPYTMIHFGKPFLEVIAAVFAGVVLGTLAMKTKSIWSGFLIHVSVALSMDVAAMVQTRGLPQSMWPLSL